MLILLARRKGLSFEKGTVLMPFVSSTASTPLPSNPSLSKGVMEKLELLAKKVHALVFSEVGTILLASLALGLYIGPAAGISSAVLALFILWLTQKEKKGPEDLGGKNLVESPLERQATRLEVHLPGEDRQSDLDPEDNFAIEEDVPPLEMEILPPALSARKDRSIPAKQIRPFHSVSPLQLEPSGTKGSKKKPIKQKKESFVLNNNYFSTPSRPVVEKPLQTSGIASSNRHVSFSPLKSQQARRRPAISHYAPNCKSNNSEARRKDEMAKTEQAVENGYNLPALGILGIERECFIEPDCHQEMLAHTKFLEEVPEVSGVEQLSRYARPKRPADAVEISDYSFFKISEHRFYYKKVRTLTCFIISKNCTFERILDNVGQGKTAGDLEELCLRSDFSKCLQAFQKKEILKGCFIPSVQVFRSDKENGYYFHPPYPVSLFLARQELEFTKENYKNFIRFFFKTAMSEFFRVVIVTPSALGKTPLKTAKLITQVLEEAEFSGAFEDVILSVNEKQKWELEKNLDAQTVISFAGSSV